MCPDLPVEVMVHNVRWHGRSEGVIVLWSYGANGPQKFSDHLVDFAFCAYYFK